jgi:hypothetical protein
MTDTTVAIETPTPPPTETPIPDSGHTGSPTPVGSQAPQKSPDRIEMERNISRRESIQRAFERSKQTETPKSEAKPSAPEAKTQQQPQKPEVKPEEAKQGRPPQTRGEGGRFTSGNQQQTEAVPQQTPAKAQPLPDTAPFRDAPQRFSDAAKTDWHSVPESVRGATTQAFKQLEDGIQQYRRDAESFHSVRDFSDLAQRSGTDLRTALTNYVSMESKLRTDLIGGLDMIVNNLNMRNGQGQKITLRDVAYHIANMTPDQLQLNSAKNASQSQDLRMGQLHNMMESLAQTVQNMQYHQQFTQHRTQVDSYAEAHPRFDELADLIKEEIDHGYPLDQAYARADKLRPSTAPATRAAQTRNTTAQTRNEVDKSIHGAPSVGNLAERKPTNVSRRDAITNAVKKVRGAL